MNQSNEQMSTNVEELNGAPIIPFAGQKEWERWLARNHTGSDGVWLKLAKKGADVASVTYAEALESALCYGWIDGQKQRFDDAWWLQKFTPRRARSIWSKVNRAKAEELIAAGRMKPAGQRAFDEAAGDGRLEAAYDSPSRAVVPEDLIAALRGNKKAEAFFATLNSANRFAILFRIHTAKKAETRARRIEQFVEMLARGEKLH